MKIHKKYFSFKLFPLSFKLSAFSLVELLIVITVLAILGIIAFLSYQSHSGKARDANRVSSIGVIKKGLELQFLKTGSYPVPDNVAGVGMINGEIVNIVGAVGDNISQMINLDKPPKDPSSDIEYMYGINENRKKFQIGATLENIQVSLVSDISYASMFTAKVEGNFEYPLNFKGKLASVPSLLFVGPSDLVNNSTGFIINGGTNLPYSPNPDYVNTQTATEQLEDITGVPGLEVKAVDFTEFTSSNDLKTASGGDIDSKLQEIGINKEQAGESMFGEKYTDPTNISIDWSKQKETTPYFCVGDVILINAIVSNDVMLPANANYQTADLGAPCYYTCKENYSGINCETFTPPPSTCATPQPNCYLAGGCELVEGTPTTQNQAWTKLATNCGFTCKMGFSGNNCEIYTPIACDSKPACYLAGGCDIVEGTATQPNQPWIKGSTNCGFNCKTNFIGTNCETYAPPSCGEAPACYANGGCDIIEGTPTSSDQAWIKGATNCGFTCKTNFTGTNCETYAPIGCGEEPTCYTNGGCNIIEGTPTQSNQTWIRGATNCGFTCKANYSGDNCENYNIPACLEKPACYTVGGCDITEGTPSSINQAWTKLATNCGFSCKTNYSGNYCETYTPPPSTCATTPICYINGGCGIIEGTPTQSNQAWLKGAMNCGFACKTNYSGDDCETYTPPSCDTKPACYTSGGCNITEGTPTQPNQARVQGASNCGFSCKTNYSGTTCQTFSPPPNTCATNPTCAGAGGCILTIGTPSTPNQAWVQGASNCGFACKTNYSGTTCQTYTTPSCATNPACVGAGGCTLTTGTPTTPNQAWVKSASNCGFSCKTNYFGTNCETYTPPSCTSNPSCSPNGCTLTTGTPTTQNQAWVKGASNCGFACKTNYSGTYCEVYTPPSCATNPACSPTGCFLTVGNPTTPNQAWAQGATNCGFTCKANYSGTNCQTYTAPSCATNPSCSPNGCTLTTGTPTTQNQAWSQGATNCGFTCKTYYSGTSCQTYTPPSCTTNPACASTGGCNLITGNPTISNQSWTQGASNCGFVCKTNYSGTSCQTYTPPSCTTNPACASAGGCTITTGSPTTPNQSWVQGATSCGFTCKTNYSGTSCQTYTPPSCASNPACASAGGCTLTTGTPTQPNQAWTRGGSNCGFVCKSGYSGTYCETYTPPSCASSPACAGAGGCTITTGSPSTPSQAWVKGASSCGFICKSGYSGTYCESFNPIDQEWKDVSGTSCNNNDIVFVDNGSTYRWAGCNSVLGTTGIYTNGGAYNGKCYSYSASYGGTACFGDTTKENAYNGNGQDNIWGKLYTWTEASRSNNACPTGRKLPTQDEFMKLEKYLTCSNYTTKDTFRCAGLGWQGSSSRTTSNNLVKALKLPLSGYRTTAGFLDRGAGGYLRTSTQYASTTAHGRYLTYSNNGISHGGYSMTQLGLSVRCIKATITGPVNAVVGDDNGKTLSSTPTNLCKEGTTSSVSGSGPWYWTCYGINGGGSVSGSANKIIVVIGTCGSSNGASLTSQPTSNLCYAGTASGVSGSGPWYWTCAGSGGGSTSSCSANKSIAGVCGGSNGASLPNPPTSNLCSIGTASGISGSGPWTWTCAGSGGGSTANCSANKAVNGICGGSNGASLTYQPTSNLCSVGTASSVSGFGPWSWTCVGSGGGSSVGCSASKIAIVNGICGSSNGIPATTAPTSNLCSAGTASSVSGSGPWTWTCAGSGGGSTASCNASKKSSILVKRENPSNPNSAPMIFLNGQRTYLMPSAPANSQWCKLMLPNIPQTNIALEKFTNLAGSGPRAEFNGNWFTFQDARKMTCLKCDYENIGTTCP